jgi:hypothetical protein
VAEVVHALAGGPREGPSVGLAGEHEMKVRDVGAREGAQQSRMVLVRPLVGRIEQEARWQVDRRVVLGGLGGEALVVHSARDRGDTIRRDPQALDDLASSVLAEGEDLVGAPCRPVVGPAAVAALGQ